jgi:hypothetical protein
VPQQPQQQYMQMPPQMMQPQMMHQLPPQQNGGINRWAQLAFNSPIKNRPGDDPLSGFGGSGGPPGTNMGKFS